MTKLKKLFGGIEMTWIKVIILSLVTAVYTALINQIPFLDGTSFQDIAINLECWILFAVFIIVNCKKWWEASLKCFVFFLISQPLIFLIEVPFYEHGFEIFMYYKYWFVVTLLTIPGAAIAFLLKKKNLLSAVVLSVATGFLGYSFAEYFNSAWYNFPHHLLSAIFCLALAVFFAFVLLDKPLHRIIVLAVTVAAVIITFICTFSNHSTQIQLPDGQWSYITDNSAIAEIEMKGGSSAELTSKRDGYAYIAFTNANNERREYYVTISGGSIWVDSLD